ncbi:hypothetical protein [Cryobacterium sp. Y11]|uniref:hypothetical protein n=1 Tax=Cryobacterium sp. Y11 TaxID=2045016 RepID=UPI000CE3A925|nr:hypothetical protein [Cryobacterium sp. Y11]
MDLDYFAPAQKTVRLATGHEALVGNAQTSILFIGPETTDELDVVAKAAGETTLVAVTPEVNAWIDATNIPDPDIDQVIAHTVVLIPNAPSTHPAQHGTALPN